MLQHTKPSPGSEPAPETNASTSSRARSRVGLVLRQKWRLDALLGIGGMAAVYAATHRNGGRGAIKMLHAEYSALPEVKRRFLREGYVGNTVTHPGVVRVLDDDIAEDGAAFLVMDLLVGETLDARLSRRGGRLPPAEILPVIDELLDILSAAHEARVIHRDVKPENVFITTEGVVKLLDFGIARLQTIQPGSLATVDGTTFGTPAFMPPEQALGHVEEIDARSDVWGAGAVLFNGLTGRLVHQTRTLNEQLVAHASRPAPALTSVDPTLDREVGRVVDRSLAFQKTDRFASARQMQTAIRDLVARRGWPRTASLAFRADPAVLSSGLQRAMSVDDGSPFPSMAATTHAITGGLAARPDRGSRRYLLAVGILVGMLTAAAILLAFVARRPPSVAEERAPTATATAAVAQAPVVAPAGSPRPIDTAAVEAPAPSEAAIDEPAPSPSASAAPVAKPTATPSKHGPLPVKSTSPAPKPAPAGDWLDRQH